MGGFGYTTLLVGAGVLLFGGYIIPKLWQWYKGPTSEPVNSESGTGTSQHQPGNPGQGQPGQGQPGQGRPGQGRPGQQNPHPENTGHGSRNPTNTAAENVS